MFTRAEVDRVMGGMCLQCCLQATFFLLQILETMSVRAAAIMAANKAVSNGIINVTPREIKAIREGIVSAAQDSNSSEVVVRNHINKVILSMPDMIAEYRVGSTSIRQAMILKMMTSINVQHSSCPGKSHIRSPMIKVPVYGDGKTRTIDMHKRVLGYKN